MAYPNGYSPIFGTPQVQPGFLGLNPDLKRQRQIGSVGDLLTGLGIGLMGQGPTTTPQGPLQGLAQGLTTATQLGQQRTAQNMQADQAAMAQGQYGMEVQKFNAEQAFQQAKNDALEKAIATLPPEQQAAARADQESFWKAYNDHLFAKPQAQPGSVQEYEYAKSQGFKGSLLDYQTQKAAAGRAPQQPNQLPSGIQEYNFAVQQGFKGTYLDFQTAMSGAGRQNAFGNTPIYGIKDGKVVVMQFKPGGGLAEAAAPDGITPVKPLVQMDLGTTKEMVSPISGQSVTSAPVDNLGQAEQTKLGTETGQAKFDLPTAENNAAQALKEVDAIRKDPALSTGALSLVLNKIPGTDWYGFQNRVDQAKAGAFMTAYNVLRGGGQISNAEGDKATAALGRLNTAQNKGDFLAALKDFEDVIKNGLAVARKKAQGGSPTSGTAPAVGNSADPLGLFTPQAPQ